MTVAARNLRLRLGRSEILHGIDFDALPGQLTCIVGPNGSGKTTLLRALTGDADYTGSVRLSGDDIRDLKPWQLAARRGVLPQSTRLAFPFTVLEVVRLGLLRGTAPARTTLPHEALAAVGLAGFEGRFYQELSGGEQQRAQLARVLTQVWSPVEGGSPRWLFLDEPVAALDIAHQLQVMRLARSYAERGGGVIAVMHDLNLTAMFADRVFLVREGLCAGFGPPEDILRDEILSPVYGCSINANTAPTDGRPYILPHAIGTGGAALSPARG